MTDTKESVMTSQGTNRPVDGGCVSEGSLQSSGIMVIASNRKVLYINKTGRDLLGRLKQEDGGAAGELPKPLAALVEEILASRVVSIEDQGWRRFTPKRLVQAQGRPLFVQAFSQPHQAQSARRLIVLTMHSGRTA